MDDFDNFYKKHIPELVKYAASFVSNEAAANDIVLEQLNKMWEKKLSFESETHAVNFVKVMIKNKALNYLRDVDSKMKICEIDDSFPVETESFAQILSSEITARLEKALATLPDKTRTIFLLCKIEKRTHQDVAKSMGLTVKSIEYHISRAMSCVKEALHDYIEDR